MKKYILFIASALLFMLPSVAEPQIPEQTAWVMDTAQVMSEAEKATLEQYLTALDLKYSLTAAEKWQIGQKKEDTGVLLFIAMNERKIRIEVGYGLEGSLTDVKSGLIIRNVMAPYFRDGQTGVGIMAGAQAIATTVAGDTAGIIDSSIKASVPEKESASSASGFSAFILIIFLILMMLGFSKKGSRSGRYQRSVSGEIIHTAIWASILSGLLGPRGPHDGFGGGSGFSSHGGFGGGGFSGGGGGSFGGGGASGGW